MAPRETRPRELKLIDELSAKQADRALPRMTEGPEGEVRGQKDGIVSVRIAAEPRPGLVRGVEREALMLPIQIVDLRALRTTLERQNMDAENSSTSASS